MSDFVKDSDKGFVHVYTGNGKGKTTAALGLCFRAAGWNMKSYIGQFMKGQLYGELRAAKFTNGMMEIEQYGKDTFIHVTDPPDPDDVKMAKEGLAKLKAAMSSGNYRIVVADEICTCHHFHLITEDQILDLMREKPAGIELILTGRHSPSKVVEQADLVTEMREIKHYYTQNISARMGIER